ncbi:MAG: ABC transporter permease [Acidihalobacter sp.]|jgi:putative lysine/arginine/ornithine/histidine/octopine transport system permease protein
MIDLQGFGNLLLAGTLVTVELSLASMAVAVVLGLIGATATRSHFPPARWLAAGYTTIVRGIPELLAILLVYFGASVVLMKIAGLFGYSGYIELSPFLAGTMALGFMYGAYASEVVRGAIDAIPYGQIEAAQAMGMHRLLVFRRIVLPQTWRLALPPLGNLFLALLKDTALISVVGANDLMRNTAIAVSQTKEPFTFYAAAALVYLLLTVVTTAGITWLERNANRGMQRART